MKLRSLTPHPGYMLLVPCPASAAASFDQTLRNYPGHFFNKFDVLIHCVYLVSAL